MYEAPGGPIGMLTFPGVIVHEFAYLFLCRLFGLGIYEVRLLQCEDTLAYIRHESPRSRLVLLALIVFPNLSNFVLGLIVCCVAMHGSQYSVVAAALLAWVGVSILMHSYPTAHQASLLLGAAQRDGRSSLSYYTLAPIGGIFWLLAQGRRFWLNVFVLGFLAIMMLREFG